MNTTITKKKTPPKTVAKSKQYDLFTEFFGDANDLSNTIELWDAVPKYAVSARRQVALRDNGRRLPLYEQHFVHAKTPCRLEVQAATIKAEGGLRDCYPSEAEELVEEVLRKIFASQHHGMHSVERNESWVKFTLSMIRSELRKRGRERTIPDIKQSIDILSKTVVRVYFGEDDDAEYTVTILSDVTRVNRAKYLDDPNAMWAARLPLLVSKSVNELSYRQFNYGTFMTLHSPLARWLHKRLSHNYVHANHTNSYEVLFSTLQRDSGMLAHARVNTNVKALEKALEELVDACVLNNWDKQERRGTKNRIDDILYIFHPSVEFVKEMKAANARRKDGAGRLKGHRHLPRD